MCVQCEEGLWNESRKVIGNRQSLLFILKSSIGAGVALPNWEKQLGLEGLKIELS